MVYLTAKSLSTAAFLGHTRQAIKEDGSSFSFPGTDFMNLDIAVRSL